MREVSVILNACCMSSTNFFSGDIDCSGGVPTITSSKSPNSGWSNLIDMPFLTFPFENLDELPATSYF